ncbi:Predicted Zn-finger protein [Ceraceosorus bombacis]|uniref:Predicted Zn-finger protein n=1 Tax=Ceraceosorus bombacis TaxID=401625 RepID=A0A0P1BR90_9BASI|nr:Predicted Zn-finger protein [Ceraceosorus bombacis]
MSLEELFNVRRAAAKARRFGGAEEDERAAQHNHGYSAADRTDAVVVCAFCSKQNSAYTCPQCNARYCSLACFRSPQHDRCSKPFVDRVLREELGEEGVAGAPGFKATDAERTEVMELLRRFRQQRIEDVPGVHADDASDEDCDNGDASLQLPTDFDPESADTAQIISALSHTQRDAFLAFALQDHRRARNVEEDGPWWTASSSKRRLPSRKSKEFGNEASRLRPPMEAASLRYNLLAVLLVYAHLIRHLDVSALQEVMLFDDKKRSQQASETPNTGAHGTVPTEGEQEYAGMPPLEDVPDTGGQLLAAVPERPTEPYQGPKVESGVRSPVPAMSRPEKDLKHDALSSIMAQEAATQKSVARDIAARALPFVNAVKGEQSRTQFASVEEVAFDVLSRLGRHWRESAAQMLALLQDALHLIFPAVEEETGSSMWELALSDLALVLSQHGRKKMVFYAAMWRTAVTDKIKQGFKEEIKSHCEILQEELNRAVEEERLDAVREREENAANMLSDRRVPAANSRIREMP